MRQPVQPKATERGNQRDCRDDVRISEVPRHV
jgi:hypothetical protein